MKTTYEEITRKFKEYRIDYPLTQKELADKTGVSLRSIARFESGKYNPTVEFLVKVCKALGKDLSIELI